MSSQGIANLVQYAHHAEVVNLSSLLAIAQYGH